MRIAHVVTYVSSDGAFGGPVAVLRAQTAALAAAGHEVEVFAGWDGAATLEIPGVRVRLFPARHLVPGTGFSGITSGALVRALRAELGRFDAVHVHLGRHLLDLQAALAVLRGRGRLVVQPHGMVQPSRAPKAIVTDALATRRILRGADRVLALTADDEAGLGAVAGAPIRMLRLPNGIAASPAAPRERAGRSVLFLARLHPRKRVLAFARAAALLHLTDPDTRFAVVGPDEGDLPALQAYLDDHRLQEVVRYEGSLPSGAGAARIAEADVYVLPAEREVFPMSVLEALSVGTPVVLARDCGIAEELERAGAAVVVDGSPESIADAVRGLLDDDARWRSTGERGRALVDTRLSIDAVAATLLSVYAGAGERRTGGAERVSS